MIRIGRYIVSTVFYAFAILIATPILFMLRESPRTATEFVVDAAIDSDDLGVDVDD